MIVVITANSQSCPDSNHPHAIDLGLPSETKWACCNIGAKKPEEAGHYYAWGETKEKEVYSWKNYSDSRDGTKYGIYCFTHHLNWGNMVNNVAHVRWGGKWQMPTPEQFKELINNCDSKWTSIKGVNGRLFTGKNGANIFFPAAGQRNVFTLNTYGNYGYYWSETEYEANDGYKAYYFHFYNGQASTSSGDLSIGRSVRAIINNK